MDTLKIAALLFALIVTGVTAGLLAAWEIDAWRHGAGIDAAPAAYGEDV